MRLLYHFALQPFSRKVRIVLREKRLEFDLQDEKPWERRDAFLTLNPAGEVPVLVEPDGSALIGSTAICEFLDEVYPDPPMLATTPLARAEIRRLVAWFDVKFYREVTTNLLEEKIFRRLAGLGGPASQALRAGSANIHYHLDYIAWLTDRRTWLAGDDFSLADAAAAAHLSALDYIGDVPWARHAEAKDWYARVKSRPSFRPLLTDQLPGVPPPRHYADLDF
ncbi:glutathione S-transferase family protein [Rhodospirillaceae bacterium SYSU D60014]|uniref:glutathione S-transferase family protein n=1 Tax=Virgifigura deserti TaxID=2268457 RepID=UPI000E65EFBF